jgi:hypothetical protein
MVCTIPRVGLTVALDVEVLEVVEAFDVDVIGTLEEVIELERLDVLVTILVDEVVTVNKFKKPEPPQFSPALPTDDELQLLAATDTDPSPVDLPQ